jgi:cystathionine gamma-synthase
LGAALRRNGGLFVIDETIGSFVNVDCLHACDAAMTSLTKYVSGVGDVIAGSLVVNPESPRYGEMREYLSKHHEPLLWGGDADALAENARDYPERMARMNDHAAQLAEHLKAHPAVESVMYPKFAHADAYERLMKPGGGYGGLLSLVTKDGERTAPRFYDALRVSKGPSLGTNYSLACPFTLLAHYNELDWAESLGVSRWLVRVSVGLEPADDLIARFDEALSSATA